MCVCVVWCGVCVCVCVCVCVWCGVVWCGVVWCVCVCVCVCVACVCVCDVRLCVSARACVFVCAGRGMCRSGRGEGGGGVVHTCICVCWWWVGHKHIPETDFFTLKQNHSDFIFKSRSLLSVGLNRLGKETWRPGWVHHLLNLQTAVGGCPFNLQTAVGGCPFNLQTAVGGCPFNFPTARLKPGISGPWYSASVSSGILVSAASHLLPSLSARAMRVAMVLVGHNKLGLRGNCAYGT